jgi:hypothetical protein
VHSVLFDSCADLSARVWKGLLSAFYPEKARPTKKQASTLQAKKQTKRQIASSLKHAADIALAAAALAAAEAEAEDCDAEDSVVGDNAFATVARLDNEVEDDDAQEMSDAPIVVDEAVLNEADSVALLAAESAFAKQVQTLVEEADSEAVNFGIICSASQRLEASKIMDYVSHLSPIQNRVLVLTSAPQPSKLASKVNNSATLGDALKTIIDGIPNLKEALARRLVTKVPTRWGSEHACLERHRRLRVAVTSLTELSVNKLQHLQFTEENWSQSADLETLLQVGSSFCLAQNSLLKHLFP